VTFVVPSNSQSFKLTIYAGRSTRTGTHTVHLDNIIVRR
jgi:hypothetical protein